MKIKVAITQMSCSANYEENTKKAEAMVKKCAEAGAQIILIQELFSNLYFCQVEDYEKFNLAEIYGKSRLISHFKEVAKRYKVVLPISFFEKSGANYFNSLVMIDADGCATGTASPRTTRL